MTVFITTHKFASGSSTVAAIGRALMAMVGVAPSPVPSPAAALAGTVYQKLGVVPASVDVDALSVAVRASGGMAHA